MTEPKIVQFKQVPKVQTRITMPDGMTYCVVTAIHTKQEILDRIIKDIVDNENNRRHLDYVGGFNYIDPETGKRFRLFREFS